MRSARRSVPRRKETIQELGSEVGPELYPNLAIEVEMLLGLNENAMVIGKGDDRIIYMLRCLNTDATNSIHGGALCVVAEPPEVECRDRVLVKNARLCRCSATLRHDLSPNIAIGDVLRLADS